MALISGWSPRWPAQARRCAFWPPGVSLARMAALTFPGSTICLPRAQVFLPTKVPVCVPAAGRALKCQVPGHLWWGNWSVEKGHRRNASCLERQLGTPDFRAQKVAVRSRFWGTWWQRNQVCLLLTDGGGLSAPPSSQTNKLPPFFPNKKASVGAAAVAAATSPSAVRLAVKGSGRNFSPVRADQCARFSPSAKSSS